MGASATIAGQNLGAGNPERAMDGVHVASRSASVSRRHRLLFVLLPRYLLAVFGMTTRRPPIGRQLLRYLSVSGLFITVALSYTGGLQGTGDTRSPLFILDASRRCRAARTVHVLSGDAALQPTTSGWRSSSVTSRAAC